MTNFIIRRLIQTLVVIALLSYFCFAILNLMPGDPIELMIQSNPKLTAEDVSRLREFYDLDKPTWYKYGKWIGTIMEGDLGYSRTYRVPVTDLIGPRLMNTFTLSLTSLLLALIISIPLGVFSALRPNSKLDYGINFIAFTGISMPSFWLGIILILIFAVNLQWLPASGTFTAGEEYANSWEAFLDHAKYLILPASALAYIQIGRFVRFTRSAMLEAMRNDYIRTAKAKGLKRSVVVWKHGFRNALLPLVTILALSFSGLFSGALITETLFAYQGVGKLIYDSISGKDFNVAMVNFMISVSMVLIMNFVADILYGFVDPRISLK